MFGILCGGRPVDSNISQVEPTKFVYVIKDAARINHMALFLLPGTVMPQEAAAAVYAKLPNSPDFILLGALTADKQSAIYRLNTSAMVNQTNDVDAMMDDDDDSDKSTVAAPVEITIGISIEPWEQVRANMMQIRLAQQTAQTSKPILAISAPQSAVSSPPPASQVVPAPTDANDIASLANKIVAHAYNYMSGFVDSQGKVPIKAFDDWWKKFKSKISADPAFLNTAV